MPAGSSCPSSGQAIAPGATPSPTIKPGRPVAASKISADRVTAGKSRVFEWQNVTAGYDLDALWGIHAMRDMLLILKKDAVPGGLLDPSRFTGFQ